MSCVRNFSETYPNLSLDRAIYNLSRLFSHCDSTLITVITYSPPRPDRLGSKLFRINFGKRKKRTRFVQSLSSACQFQFKNWTRVAIIIENLPSNEKTCRKYTYIYLSLEREGIKNHFTTSTDNVSRNSTQRNCQAIESPVIETRPQKPTVTRVNFYDCETLGTI